jgi:transforming growth factor-beta-induced protein
MESLKFNFSAGKLALALILSISLAAVSCSKEEDQFQPAEPEGSLADIPTLLENSELYPELFLAEDDLLKHGGKAPAFSKRPPTFVNLVLGLVKTNLISTVAKNQLTLFAPSDEAFEKLFKELGVKGIKDIPADVLRPILLYHAVNGKIYSYQLSNGFVPTLNGAAVEVKLNGGVMINDAKVVRADVRALNGVIHVIDKVLMPPTQNIVEIAAGNPNFSILVDAVKYAELDGVLATGGPFTVFAPTNDAFIALLAELKLNSFEELVAAIGKDGLTKVLLYHVVSGRVYSSDLPAGPLSVKTLNGQSFVIDASQIKITDAVKRYSYLIPDLLNIQATNGVIHVINRVILPIL